jgi:hypothetical protein
MVAASLFAGLARSQAISFCTDEVCNDCPVAPGECFQHIIQIVPRLTSRLRYTGQAVGYPLCNIYDSKTVIGDYGFETAAGLANFLLADMTKIDSFTEAGSPTWMFPSLTKAAR